MFRIRLVWVLYLIVVVPLSLLLGSSIGGSDDHPPSNGLLVLASRRDLRSPGGHRLANRFDTQTWNLYLFGMRVLVDWQRNPRRLLDDRGSVLGDLEAVDEARHLYQCRMAGGVSAPFVLVSRKQQNDSRTSPFARG
jgi:hypothetical protein